MIIYYLLFMHWVADFLCQTKWMAENKSSSLTPLLLHIMTYVLVCQCMLFPYALATGANRYHYLGFVLVNGLAHLCTDFVSSKITKFAYTNMDKPWGNKLFWSTIGADQLAHVVVLIATARALIGA